MRHMFTVLHTENQDLRREIICLKEEKDQPPTSNAHYRPPGINMPSTSCHGQYRPPFTFNRPSSPTSSTNNDVQIQTRLHQEKAFKNVLTSVATKFNGNALEYAPWKRALSIETENLHLTSTQQLQLLEVRTELEPCLLYTSPSPRD